jgi:hypothetical protein
MKIAITGHSSGIGRQIDTILSLTETDWEVRGYSKSNGHNIADDNGDKIIQTLLDYDPDVVFNNAYYPKMQTKILEHLYSKWSDKPKVIINTGSISGHLTNVIDSGSDYVKDKKQMQEFCIRSSFNYPWYNKTRLYNISFGFVNTALITNTTKNLKFDLMIDEEKAAWMLIDLIDEKPYHVVEQVVNCTFAEADDMMTTFNTASRNIMKHVARSNKNKT